jgi:hypothetical protein
MQSNILEQQHWRGIEHSLLSLGLLLLVLLLMQNSARLDHGHDFAIGVPGKDALPN